MTKPVTPEIVATRKHTVDTMPDAVIVSINRQIMLHWHYRKNDEVVEVPYNTLRDVIASQMKMYHHQVEISGYMDFEHIFEAAGWDILYIEDAPGSACYRFYRK